MKPIVFVWARLLTGGFAALTAAAGAVLLMLGGWIWSGCLALVLIAAGYGYIVYGYMKLSSVKFKESNNVSEPADGGESVPSRAQEMDK